jgi:CRP-like cAMP-binding protein
MSQQGSTALALLARRLFPGLDQAGEARRLAALPHTIRAHEAGHYLLREGDRPKYCSIIVSGVAYRHKFVGNGGRQIVSVHISGDFMDLQNALLDQADHNIQALTGITVAQIAVEAIIDLAFVHPAIGKALWRETLIEGSIFREWVANVGRRDARSRTAHLLCELALRREIAGLGERNSFELAMTQEQLGDALGLTAVHVNRTLKALQDEGLIVRSKRSVTVVSWDRLRDAADFTSSYLHAGPPAP